MATNMNTFDPASAQTPAGNTAAVCTMATPPTSARWRVRFIGWSYSAAPTAGSLTIAWTDGSTNYSEVYYITAGGPGQLTWEWGRKFPVNQAVTVTLAAGGGTVQGSVYVDADTGN